MMHKNWVRVSGFNLSQLLYATGYGNTLPPPPAPSTSLHSDAPLGKLLSREKYSVIVYLLSKTICRGISVYFGWVRVGLSEMQFKFQLGTSRMLSTTQFNPPVSFRCCFTVFVLFTGYSAGRVSIAKRIHYFP